MEHRVHDKAASGMKASLVAKQLCTVLYMLIRIALLRTTDQSSRPSAQSNGRLANSCKAVHPLGTPSCKHKSDIPKIIDEHCGYATVTVLHCTAQAVFDMKRNPTRRPGTYPTHKMVCILYCTVICEVMYCVVLCPTCETSGLVAIKPGRGETRPRHGQFVVRPYKNNAAPR